MKKHALVIGGTSGLGFELANELCRTHEITLTGRALRQPGIGAFHSLHLGEVNLGAELDTLLAGLPKIDLLVYAAGFAQFGHIDKLTDADIDAMYRVGLGAPAMLIARIIRRQRMLPGIIAITSTSEWTPRELEPMYTATKAGLGMLMRSLSLSNEQFPKVLTAGPSGMRTAFWEREKPGAWEEFLEPSWVARQILEHWRSDFSYKYIRVLREPLRVEVMEVR